MKNLALIGLVLVALPLEGIANAKPQKGRWEATRTTDPITGATTCVVAAYDTKFNRRISYSQIGGLYPIVENSEKFGLLVGVSSGGRFRMPVGDILWRVDQRPFRELRASNNPTQTPVASVPAIGEKPTIPGVSADLAAEIQRKIDETYALSAKLAAGMGTSTVASKDEAWQMLTELLEGQGLIFRRSSATTTYGLPSSAPYRVGEVDRAGVYSPIPIDDSLRQGLLVCGINPEFKTLK